MSRVIGRTIVRFGLAIALFFVIACGGSDDKGTGDTTDAGADHVDSQRCTTNAECAAKVPPTMPAHCAEGACNTLQGTCVFSAKDEDGDGHRAADCKSTNGVAIVTEDDCNDHDPNLYPGHPESCTTLADGGTAGTDICAPGKLTCLSGVESACEGTTVCTNQACVNEKCIGTCAPGDEQCASNGVQTCTSDGTWGAQIPCSHMTCISKAEKASCEGICAPGSKACSGDQPQICVGGVWVKDGSACSGDAPVCKNDTGECVACTPNSLGCDLTQPQQCNVSGTAWQDVGAPCNGTVPACLKGACVACSEGAAQCSGGLPQTCDASGNWDTGTCPAHELCYGTSCTAGCNIGGTDYAPGAANPTDACQICNPIASKTAWTNDATLDGTSCGTGGTCCSGACVDEQTDTSHCGSCTNACTDGTSPSCGTGRCSYVLAAGQNFPQGVAVNASSVCWTDEGTVADEFVDGTVMMAPLAGGTAVTLATHQDETHGIAVNSTNVYWVDEQGTGDDNYGSINTAPLSGGVTTGLAFGENGATLVAIDATSVYWTNANAGTVLQEPLGGAADSTPLASGQQFPFAIAVDVMNVYWVNNGMTSTTGTVMQAPLGGGAPTTLASAQANPQNVAVDATSVYWTSDGSYAKSYTDSGLMKVPIGGGTVTTLAPDHDFPGAIAVDGANVYWINRGGSVMKVPAGGGTVTTIAAAQADPTGIAVDRTSVYWTNGGTTGTDGTVMKAQK